MTGSVLNASRPSLQVSKEEVDYRQIFFRNPRVTALGDIELIVPALDEVGVAGPVIGEDLCAPHGRFINEAAKRLRTAFRHDGESDSPCISTAISLVELGARLALANLYNTGDKDCVMDASNLTARPAVNISLIDLNVRAELTANI